MLIVPFIDSLETAETVTPAVSPTFDAGKYVLSDRNLHLNRTVLGNNHARLLPRMPMPPAVYVYSRNRTRARSGYRAKACLLVDLVHGRLNLRQRRGLLGLSLRDTCLRLRQCRLALVRSCSAAAPASSSASVLLTASSACSTPTFADSIARSVAVFVAL